MQKRIAYLPSVTDDRLDEPCEIRMLVDQREKKLAVHSKLVCSIYAFAQDDERPVVKNWYIGKKHCQSFIDEMAECLHNIRRRYGADHRIVQDLPKQFKLHMPVGYCDAAIRMDSDIIRVSVVAQCAIAYRVWMFNIHDLVGQLIETNNYTHWTHALVNSIGALLLCCRPRTFNLDGFADAWLNALRGIQQMGLDAEERGIDSREWCILVDALDDMTKQGYFDDLRYDPDNNNQKKKQQHKKKAWLEVDMAAQFALQIDKYDEVDDLSYVCLGNMAFEQTDRHAQRLDEYVYDTVDDIKEDEESAFAPGTYLHGSIVRCNEATDAATTYLNKRWRKYKAKVEAKKVEYPALWKFSLDEMTVPVVMRKGIVHTIASRHVNELIQANLMECVHSTYKEIVESKRAIRMESMSREFSVRKIRDECTKIETCLETIRTIATRCHVDVPISAKRLAEIDSYVERLGG
jgi:hypothetical protein